MIISNGTAVGLPPEALAETNPLLANGYFYGDNTLSLLGYQAAYDQLYRKQLWVQTLTKKVGVSLARLPLLVWEQTPSGRVAQPDSDYQRLLSKPNDRLTGHKLKLWTQITFEIYGEAFWLKVRNDAGKVLGLYPMHPTRTTIHRDEQGEIFYLFTLGSRQNSIVGPIPEDNVVPFIEYNPENMMRGLSRLEALRQTLFNEDASRRATASWWQRGARPSVALVHPKTLSQDAADRLKQSFDARHGGADNMGGTAVLEEGMEPKILQLNAEEMQYIESRKLNREEVCAIYDVPPPVVHILDRATFSNITEQMRSMYRDSMAYRLDHFQDVLDLYLRPDFDKTGSIKAEFALDEVLQGDFETLAVTIGNLVDKGVMKPAEGRAKLRLPDAGPVADKLYANATLVPLGSTERAAPVPGEPVSRTPLDSGPGPAPVKTVNVRALNGKLARLKANRAAQRSELVDAHATTMRNLFSQQRQSVKDTGSFDPEDWNDGLAADLSPLATSTVKSFGQDTAAGFGSTYDVAIAAAWLDRNVAIAASNINQTTAGDVAELDPEDPNAVDDLFDGYDSRADQIATSRVTDLEGFATHDAAAHSGAVSKTWTVNSDNPRPSHAAMDGETIPLDEDFSNGLRWPGDSGGDPDETAGCTCTLEFSKEDA